MSEPRPLTRRQVLQTASLLGVSTASLSLAATGTSGAGSAIAEDSGNFHGDDPYSEIAQAAPFAVNVQVKTEIRRQGMRKEPADLARVIGILREANYSGYVVLEYNAEEDAKTAVPRYVGTLRSLIAS